jgi:hypothetical protein
MVFVCMRFVRLNVVLSAASTKPSRFGFHPSMMSTGMAFDIEYDHAILFSIFKFQYSNSDGYCQKGSGKLEPF